jgi:acyl-CoA hydrolase
MFRSGRMPLDVALIQVTPPDNYGFCSFGVSVEAVKAAADTANLVGGAINNTGNIRGLGTVGTILPMPELSRRRVAT